MTHGSATDYYGVKITYPGTIEGALWNKEPIHSKVALVESWASRYSIPRSRIWCGEVGCARWASGCAAYLRDFMQVCEEETIGYSMYAYREWSVTLAYSGTAQDIGAQEDRRRLTCAAGHCGQELRSPREAESFSMRPATDSWNGVDSESWAWGWCGGECGHGGGK